MTPDPDFSTLQSFAVSVFVGLAFFLLTVAIAFGYPIRRPPDPMAAPHGDVPHIENDLPGGAP
jgi:hypothetical protein